MVLDWGLNLFGDLKFTSATQSYFIDRLLSWNVPGKALAQTYVSI
jgi:hypothetical protein